MNDWSGRVRYNYGAPYTEYSIGIAPLPRLEANFNLTQIRNLPGFNASYGAGYGQYKDKAFNFKFLVTKEHDLMPAIAVGMDDFAGTALYGSSYLVSTKRYGFVDFSAGYGVGRIGGQSSSEYGARNSNSSFSLPSTQAIKKGKMFGAIEAHITPDLALNIEYSPINYTKDSPNPFNGSHGATYKPSVTKINFGATYELLKHLKINLNYERGNSYTAGFFIDIPFTKEILYPHEANPKWRANDAKKATYTNLSDNEVASKLAVEVAAEQMIDVDTAINGNKIWVGFANGRYSSDMKAIGRTADTIDEVAPQRFEKFYIALKELDIPVAVVEIDRTDERRIKYNPYSSENEIAKSLILTDDTKAAWEGFVKNSDGNISKGSFPPALIGFIWKPSIENYLNDPSQPFATRIGVLLGYKSNPWPGFFFKNRYMFTLYNNTGNIPNNQLEPNNIATRTNNLPYIQYSGPQNYELAASQLLRLPYGVWGRASVGYFEPQYGGVQFEAYKPLANGKYGIGLEYQNVNSRTVNNMWTFQPYNFNAKLVNLFANLEPELGLSVSARVGQFLASDTGYRIQFMRTYKEYTIGFWFAKTKSQYFTSTENINSQPYGVMFSIPLSAVNTKDLKGALGYGIQPWSRDGAQFAEEPFSLIGRGGTSALEYEIGKFDE